MKRELESIIRENLQEFQTEELPEGYIQRFEKKLTKNRPQQRRKIVWFGVATGAVAATLVGLFFLVAKPNGGEKLNGYEQEIANIHSYYQGQQERTCDIIEELLKSANQEVQNEIHEQLSVMKREDIIFKEEFHEYNTSYNKNLLTHEINYYRARQDDLEYLQKILER